MKPVNKIKELINKSDIATSPDADRRILAGALKHLDKLKCNKPAPNRPHIWRTIMKSPITKIAAAVVIIVVVIMCVDQFSTNGSAVAWGNVTARAAKVDFVHFYELRCDQNGLEAICEGWHAHGKTMRLSTFGNTSYDDGQITQEFDRHKVRTGKGRSELAVGQTFFEVMSKDLLSTDNDQFNQQYPVNVGGDFLVYRFEPSEEQRNWLKGTSVTVGRNSLLPIQIKTHYDAFYGKGYELVIFDYEEAQRPAEFFEPPTDSEAPHGKSRIVLDGEEVTIEIKGAPGLKHAIVRLHTKYDGPADQFPLDYIRSDRHAQDFCRAVSERARKTYEKKGGPVYRLDVAFITEEGLRSKTNDIIVLWLNEGMKCGVGDDNWPDGKYRNIVFTPLLKPTDKEKTFTVEINCWLRTKND
ncbi:hypothetical protein ACFL3Q_04930 [Planctomycetota bacterium]